MRRLILGLLALAAWGLQAWLHHGLGTCDREINGPLLTPRPEIVHLLKTDFDDLVADGFWIAVLLHNGEQLQILDESRRDFRGMFEALDLVGDLDPRFGFATTLGAWLLADGRETGQAEELLAKRIRQHPQDWQYPYHLGFVEFLYGHHYLPAAEAFLRASRLPGCPSSALHMAAGLYARGNKQDLAIATWRNIFVHGDHATRGMAQRALARLGVRLP